MELLVEELINSHEEDKNLTGMEVQEEVRELRRKHNRVDDDLEDDEQLVGLDWTNAPLEEFHFENIKLSNEEKNAELTMAKLQRAHLEKAILKSAHLELANLENTHLEGADLTDAYLVGTNFKETHLQGSKINLADFESAEFFRYAIFDKIDESEPATTIETYLKLEGFFKKFNWNDRAAQFYFNRKELSTRQYLENWMRNKIDIKQLLGFFYHRGIGFLCGYGERPWRVIRGWIFTVIIASIFYFIFWGGLEFIRANNLSKIFETYLNSIYFSGVTFTTLGFGDLAPEPGIPLMKIIAMIEAFIGAFLMALFVVTLSRKMIR